MESIQLYGGLGFHSTFDTDLAFKPGHVVETRETKYFIVQERTVSYRFYLHQQPYVQPLMQRLLRRGTRGLQAADTEFNTPIRLSAATAATDTSGRPVQLAAGEVVSLPDGTTVTLADARVVRFAGSKVLNTATEDQLTLTTGTVATVAANTLILTTDGRSATLDGATAVALIDGTPRPVLYADFFDTYQPNTNLIVQPYPARELDFSPEGAYSIYNWELFFHVPMAIAVQLSKNQRYAEAQKWFHFLFDPTDDSDGPTPERFWKVRPFQTTDVRKIEEILVNLSTNADPKLRRQTINSIKEWREAPFRPHVIARVRQQAYMFKTVMAYLDNLIAWGDSLFRQDTGEAVDEALMLYVLAAEILGPRPQAVPKKGKVRPQTYDNLRHDLTDFGTAMRDVEADLLIDLVPGSGEPSADDDRLATLRSLGKALYFCVPRNDKLLGYWDTVADRLFKIRNSLNLQGAFRQLALFEPPIDPALLARATAAGLDVGAIVNGINQPLPLVRFQLLVQKAAEIAQEVKSLGNNLLSAMEKEDGEALAALRARHERTIMEMVEHVKYAQLQEAIKSKDALLQTLAVAVQRYTYYERQLGKKVDEIAQGIPALDEIDKDALGKMKFAAHEPTLGLREIDVDIATDIVAQAAQTLNGGKLLSSHEVRESLLLEGGQLASDIANILNIASSVGHFVPNFSVHAQPMGVGATTHYGGSNVGSAVGAIASASRAIAERLNFEARRAARIDGFARRERDWAFQSNLAAGEIVQIFRQLRAAQIREAIAESELKNHREQINNAKEIEQFLNEEGTAKNGKRTNKSLYAWMKREVKGLYAQSFQFAFDVARKAERALQHELGNPELSFLQFGYLAGKEGLLAGEKLYLDVKRMEMAYHDQNQREYEMTKHVSLLQVDPLALVELRASGRCSLRIPEAFFDIDCPGHYFRRIKSVGISVPCVTGPYAGVNCTLTLTKSSIRKTPVLKDSQYPREDSEDDRFDDYFGRLESIVASSGQNDSGMFETNLRDERYLPFENAGAVSDWEIRLPADPRKEPALFDYQTISDVLLHVRYTAREGGRLLRDGAMTNVTDLIAAFKAAGSVRLFSVRQEFPSEWAKFQSQPVVADQGFELKIELRKEHYPFWGSGRLKNLGGIELVACSAGTTTPANIDIFSSLNMAPAEAKMGSLVKDRALGDTMLRGRLTAGLPASPTSTLTMFSDTKALSDLWIAVTWGG